MGVERDREESQSFLPDFRISAGIAGGNLTTPLIITESGLLSGFLINTAGASADAGQRARPDRLQVPGDPVRLQGLPEGWPEPAAAHPPEGRPPRSWTTACRVQGRERVRLRGALPQEGPLPRRSTTASSPPSTTPSRRAGGRSASSATSWRSSSASAR